MKQAILVVSFGTSYHESRVKHIEAIEKTIEAEFEDYDLRRAFTSRIIIGILNQRDGIQIDGVPEALEKLADEGYDKVIIQPTLVVEGKENDCTLAAAEEYKNRFKQIVCGNPLLSEEEDYQRLIDVLKKDLKEYDQEGTEIILMGHGTEHPANKTYNRLAELFRQKGYDRFHVGTVEAEPSIKTMEEAVGKTDSKHVVLQPLMIVSGDHAHNDMSGRDADSWKSRLESKGYQVECRLKGMGELEGVCRMFVDHARMAEKKMEDMV